MHELIGHGVVVVPNLGKVNADKLQSIGILAPVTHLPQSAAAPRVAGKYQIIKALTKHSRRQMLSEGAAGCTANHDAATCGAGHRWSVAGRESPTEKKIRPAEAGAVSVMFGDLSVDVRSTGNQTKVEIPEIGFVLTDPSFPPCSVVIGVLEGSDLPLA